MYTGTVYEPWRNNQRTMKIVIVGDPCVGKLSFINTLMDGNNFSYDLTQTNILIKITYPHIYVYNYSGFYLILQLVRGNVPLNSIRDSPYRTTDVVLIMFDVSNRMSFDNIDKWFQDVERYATNSMVVLIGNKVDSDQRKVTYEEGKTAADRIGAFGYFEFYMTDKFQKQKFEKLLTLIIGYYDNIFNTTQYPGYPLSLKLLEMYKKQQYPIDNNNNNNNSNNNSCNINIFKNRIILKHILQMIPLFRYDGQRIGKFNDDLFLATYHHFNVFSYKLSQSIPFKISIKKHPHPFFDILRYCTDIEVTKYLIINIRKSKLSKYNAMIANSSVLSGSLELVQWIHKKYSFRCTIHGLKYAIIIGSLEILDYILNTSLDITCEEDKKHAIDLAIQHQHQHIEQYLDSYKVQTTVLTKLKNKLLK